MPRVTCLCAWASGFRDSGLGLCLGVRVCRTAYFCVFLRMAVCARVSVSVSLCEMTLIYGAHIFEGFEHCLKPKPKP